MLAVFWGPVHGQVATTANMLAISAMLALDYKMPILLAHTHFERSTLEKAFHKLQNASGNALLDDGGIDEIERLNYSGLLTPDKVKYCAQSFLENRLDVITGMSNGQNMFVDALPHILEASNRFYKLTCMDVSAGNKNELSKLLLQLADLVVVNLNQNTTVLESFFNGDDIPEALQGKNVVYCIGNYQHDSKMSVNRIANLYDLDKKRICTVPSYVPYHDAQNDGDIPACFIRWKKVKKKRFEFNETVHFMESIQESGNCLLEALNLIPQAVGAE